MEFTLRQLQALVAVDDRGSVSAASEKLDISQAAVSSLLRGLETSLGMPLLLKRRGARAVLTPGALALLPEARMVLERAASLQLVANNLTKTFRELRVGARPYLIDRWLRDAVALFQRDNPQVSISLVRGTNDEILSGLAEGKLSLGILMSDSRNMALPSRQLGAFATSLYVSSNHPLAQRDELSINEIAQFDFVFPPTGSPLERRITALLESAGIRSVPIAARTEYFEALRMMTLNGVGIGVMFDNDADEYVRNGQLVRLPIELSSVSVISARTRNSDEYEKEIDDFLTDYLRRSIIPVRF